MSFGDLIGKLQSVVSSFGTEETKKTEKKEDISDTSVFASTLKEANDESDITGIEIDFSEAENEVADQIFVNRQINRNKNDAEEFKARVADNLSNANIPEELKDELTPLYSQLC